MKSTLSVIAGALVWFVLWAASNAALDVAFPHIKIASQALLHVPMLTTLIVISVGASIAAGYVTGWVAGAHELVHCMALGILQLGLGLYFEISYWNLLPTWYHLTFLTLLIPGNLFGGWLRWRKRGNVAR